MVKFFPDGRIAVSSGRAPVSCLKSIFQVEITQLCLSPSQKVRGALLQSIFTFIKWEHSQSLIKAVINALIAEKPERTGLLKPQQARTTKKPIVTATFYMFFNGIWKNNFHRVYPGLSPFLWKVCLFPAYLIFVIFFTRAKFLQNKIYTEKTRKLRQNTE